MALQHCRCCMPQHKADVQKKKKKMEEKKEKKQIASFGHATE